MANPLKCEWGVKETHCLGYWVTPTGLKSWTRKIQAILALERPNTVKQLRSFIGAFTFYCDMFHNRPHILAPLTTLVHWSGARANSFVQMKASMAHNALLRYHEHNQPFHIYTVMLVTYI
jgi:hypothetical protein